MRNGRTWATAVMRRLGRRGRAEGERGAVLVEAAIVIPILMMITLGIIEYGSAYQQDAAVAAASRAGARVASALTKTPFDVVTTVPAGDSSWVTAQSVASALQSVGNATPLQMEIYRVQSGCTAPLFSGCTYKINYKWDSVNKQWKSPTGTAWLANKQYACPGGTNPNGGGSGPDQIGIWVQMTHKGVTKMFGGDKTLSGQTIMRLEPNPDSANCGVS